MVTMRKVEGTGFAAKKGRPASDGLKHPALVWKEELMRLRVAWAETANKHLQAAGLHIRIDHRSLEARGIDREPEPKQGPLATKIERDGGESRAGAERREVQARNAERARLKLEHAEAVTEEKRIVDMMTHRLKYDELGREPLTEELLRQQQKREMDLLREMRDQDVRLQAFKQQTHQDAEEAKRKQAETARDEERRHRDGDIASAAARYSIALGEQDDMRDPYGSLARAAMQEYAMFHRRQEQMREEIAKEQDDPEKRRIIELKRMIEGYEYMVITSERLADMSVVITGREDSPQAALDRDRARIYQEWARERREERSRLIEEQEKRDRANAADLQRTPGEPARPIVDNTRSNDNKREEVEEEDRQKGKLGKRREGQVEMTDVKREKLARLAETEAAYAQHDAAKQQQREHGMGGHDGR
jgi:MobA/MobL family protein